MFLATTAFFFPLSFTTSISTTTDICLRTGSSSTSSCNSTKATIEATLPTNDVSPSAEFVPLPFQFKPGLKLK
uniref:WGS project CBMD000000000 data, contig CS3427_c000418 n=2 Tax=Fusarium pseudograminearum TaxID=101028 RepID=A0A096PCJ4_FUSPS|nr:unnamed protein product [Fusarium pseudograminearum CS3427]CEG02804.1 unnamed protein product [Fusarium pseudograminearum CS3487]